MATLKTALLSKTFSWYSLHPYKSLPCHIPDCPLSLKVILLGSREELALLNEVDEGFIIGRIMQKLKVISP